MSIIQKIYCPNCGSEGERHYITSSQIVRTQCPSCDYLMVTCSQTGRVIEAYAPGIDARKLSMRRPELSTGSIRLQSPGVTNTDSNLLLFQNAGKGLDAAGTRSLIGRLSDGIVGD